MILLKKLILIEQEENSLDKNNSKSIFNYNKIPINSNYSKNSLKILENSLVSINNSENDENINKIISEIDSIFFEEEQEEKIVEREIINIPVDFSKINKRVIQFEKYENDIAAKLSSNTLEKYDQFGF